MAVISPVPTLPPTFRMFSPPPTQHLSSFTIPSPSTEDCGRKIPPAPPICAAACGHFPTCTLLIHQILIKLKRVPKYFNLNILRYICYKQKRTSSKEKQSSRLQSMNSLRMGQTVKVNSCEASVGGGGKERAHRPVQVEPSENLFMDESVGWLCDVVGDEGATHPLTPA